MATPRIFVSSTCYDLQEIRFQLMNFIKEYGYESVLSEFDDIFYHYDKHVQDSCLEEIPKCQLFILVIGNNYGSFYHRENNLTRIPDSVTLKEFREALDHKISKHIFVNRYVDYDYKNYKRAFEKEVLKYFQENSVADDKIYEVRYRLKENFDKAYHFSNDSYRYVFYFLDIIYDLSEGNAIIPFESFHHIKESLKKQWAGLLYEALTKRNNTDKIIIDSLENKISNIEKNISKLLQSKTSDNGANISFDISNLVKELDIENLEKLKDTIIHAIWDMCNYVEVDNWGNESYEKKITFNDQIDTKLTKTWLDRLSQLAQSYKWSKTIDLKILFENFPIGKIESYNNDASYKSVLELASIYSSLTLQDKESFISTICQELDRYYEHTNATSNTLVEDDDLPF